ncbi:PREDICTED: uncharacterized protein LOC108363270 [Rhagoletis zephyria]|uniref:uncharacterized protein LOC108363270 n=1 Tax=Rhagoletis zephyria TaxID=28612 RepID=UPI0008115D05|nr:PREDICTED: uncharacterized protein LOC108363270 [Rhagoletis zephyria]XP_036322947.1 uncharacterized protein LOC118736917 [Rhagoletis pomonella]
MDDRLQQLFHLRTLQDEAIAYRNNMSLYRTLMKQTCKAELENLVNVDIKIADTQLRIPDPKLIPPLPTNDKFSSKVDEVLEELEMTSIGMKLL